MRTGISLAIAAAFSSLAAPVAATTFTVGPPGSGRQFTQLSAVFNSNNLAPGDIVEVDGNATYSSVVVSEDDSGAAGNPVIIRWNRTAGGSRPVLQGGVHTIKFAQSDHVVFEGFEVRGGSSTCVFNEAHDVTVRDAVIHDCPAHGILGADNNSGSFTLEYSEIFDAGAGQTKHPLYIQSDEIAHPGSVFRMRFNYVHSGNGGNLLKSRHERNEIHYNWFEGSVFQEIELIGPDCLTQQNGWTRATKREDSELVGNVIVHTSTWSNAIRLGGDLNGASDGRVRMLNNTILIDRAGAANAVYVQLGLGSLEMHNNAIFQTGTTAPAIVRENTGADTPECSPFSTQPWSNGRKIYGTHNWVESSATSIPAEWGVTFKGNDPVFADSAQRNLRPLPTSPLANTGMYYAPASPDSPFPSPLPLALFDPPQRSKLAIGAERPRMRPGANRAMYDIGAFEDGEGYIIRPAIPIPPPVRPRTIRPAVPITPWK